MAEPLRIPSVDQTKFMVYGATGYTGQLVVAEAVASGLRPVLAGRSAEKLARTARRWGLETRTVALGDADGLVSALQDVAVVLHCAGPFSRTAEPVVDACLRTHTHYLDITGEVAVFEALAARDTAASQAGIMILPGVGFDVLPSDCLIADLATRHPGGQRVRLGFAALSGVSRGTLRTVLEGLGDIRIRCDGAIVRVAPGSLRHEFDFGEGPDAALISVLGDVATAYRSTGIPNIETYSQANRQFRLLTWTGRRLGWLLARRLPRHVLDIGIKWGPAGPTERERQASSAIFVAEIEDADGNRATARLRAPDPYGFTAKAATAIAAHALRGDLKIGYQTPSSAYGADFVRQFEGVEWDQLES